VLNITKLFGIVIYTIAIMFHNCNIYFSSKRLDYMSVFMYLWDHNLHFFSNKLVQVQNCNHLHCLYNLHCCCKKLVCFTIATTSIVCNSLEHSSKPCETFSDHNLNVCYNKLLRFAIATISIVYNSPERTLQNFFSS
jgi:hypothetical protein